MLDNEQISKFGGDIGYAGGFMVRSALRGGIMLCGSQLSSCTD